MLLLRSNPCLAPHFNKSGQWPTRPSVICFLIPPTTWFNPLQPHWVPCRYQNPQMFKSFMWNGLVQLALHTHSWLNLWMQNHGYRGPTAYWILMSTIIAQAFTVQRFCYWTFGIRHTNVAEKINRKSTGFYTALAFINIKWDYSCCPLITCLENHANPSPFNKAIKLIFLLF